MRRSHFVYGSSRDAPGAQVAIRQLIRRMIEREAADDVLSDDQIVAELRKRDVVLARRRSTEEAMPSDSRYLATVRRAKALGR